MTVPFEYNGLGPVHGADYGRTVASANDVAVYGGLCALATLTRDELITQVFEAASLEPHVRKAISLFTTAKYQACLDLLRHYHSDWCLDVFLGASAGGSQTHVDALFARIREKSITAYFSSFSEVALTSLASTFPPTSSSPTAMEDEVISMIESGRLDARLDVVNGILVAPRRDVRRTTHGEALQAAREVERGLLLRLHGVNVVMGGLKVPRGHPGGGGVGVAGGAWE
ncbi:COP9 singlesome subunit 1 [Teratosphaeria destructans]|uniref:COP9 singlesome subunit 1 n=1 Tax=Teratosphaeria destructans TaxID=418781 RepID=A0A9W7T090_9PEZI|nr:COP9 singlesome subunit 1 [Teratosphaeria destructans]